MPTKGPVGSTVGWRLRDWGSKSYDEHRPKIVALFDKKRADRHWRTEATVAAALAYEAIKLQ
jgi:hypothetical protein